MNSHINTANLVREHIKDLLPYDIAIDKSKLNINLRYMVDVPKDISADIPLSMSVIFGIYSMANFISQFQYKINLNGSKIPTNIIAFLLAKSGGGKDSSISAMRKALDPGYIVIEQSRTDSAMQYAKNKAEQEDGDTANWQKHYREPQPLENSISTVEGLTNRLNNFAKDGLGMPSILVSELGSELQTNPNMSDNIRLISELFDTGDKKSKAIKDSERQDSPVHGMGMCSLFVGSEDNIILDKIVSAKFKTEFITKLARRSITVYSSAKEFEDATINYTTYEDMVDKQDAFENMAYQAKAFINSASNDIANTLLNSEKRLIEIDDDALRAYKDYKVYTTALGNGIDYIHKSVQLEQLHRSWKMLKLAGVFTLWDNRDSINMNDITESIYITEMLGKYLTQYEEYAQKESYELCLDYFKAHPEHNLTLHNLKKRGFISGSSGIDTKVRELVRMADSLAASDGIVKIENDIVSYKPFESVNGNHLASYVKVSGNKQERAVMCHTGFISKDVSFTKLSSLLTNDTAYTPFKFMDGHRKNDNIISGATWVALDVDDSDVTITEMHDMLDGINHHIATTSDRENPYKFRIILEFNCVVDLPVREWKVFGKALGAELGIQIDPVTFTKSQIMFGYKGSIVYSETTGDAYDVSDCIKEASKKVAASFNKEHTPTITQRRGMLDKPLETFNYAFSDAGQKNRSLSLFRMWKQAKDLGARADECEQLMRDLNYSFWDNGVSDERFEGYVRQMKGSYNDA